MLLWGPDPLTDLFISCRLITGIPFTRSRRWTPLKMQIRLNRSDKIHFFKGFQGH